MHFKSTHKVKSAESLLARILDVSRTDPQTAGENFLSLDPNRAPANAHGQYLTLSGTGFLSDQKYECRFFCDSQQCNQNFHSTGIPRLVKSYAHFVSSTMLYCSIPMWPFQAASTNVSLWQGLNQIRKDTLFSSRGLDTFTFYGGYLTSRSAVIFIDSLLLQRFGYQHRPGSFLLLLPR